MKLYIEIIKLLFKKIVLRKNTGTLIKDFSLKMGIVYIKLAQMLATQNYGNLFKEEDRKRLEDIVDDVNPISYDEIESILKEEYGDNVDDVFLSIDKDSIGSASVSQVHKAILKTGEEVAIKIKRKDVAKTFESDIEDIRKIINNKIIHKVGKIVKIENFIGGNHALDLYLDWIKQEIDFKHEIENIKAYQDFANSVNGKVQYTKKIKIPKLYEKYCTDNIIVMEFIKDKTIKNIELNDENKNKIAMALNSYIKLSLWALFNDKTIVFHGDPHSGNICIDENGNICFLDMGLLYTLSDSDAKLCRDFFLSAYLKNYEKIYNMLVPYGNMTDEKKDEFKNDCKKYCDEVNKKEVTYYFIDMMNICLSYEFVPPDFLFNMAKAFICLNGISKLSDNECDAKELLQKQTMEFLIQRSLKDCSGLVMESLRVSPSILENTLKNDFVDTVYKLVCDNDYNEFRNNLKRTYENLNEVCKLIKVSSDNNTNQKFKTYQR